MRMAMPWPLSHVTLRGQIYKTCLKTSQRSGPGCAPHRGLSSGLQDGIPRPSPGSTISEISKGRSQSVPPPYHLQEGPCGSNTSVAPGLCLGHNTGTTVSASFSDHAKGPWGSPAPPKQQEMHCEGVSPCSLQCWVHRCVCNQIWLLKRYIFKKHKIKTIVA